MGDSWLIPTLYTVCLTNSLFSHPFSPLSLICPRIQGKFTANILKRNLPICCEQVYKGREDLGSNQFFSPSETICTENQWQHMPDSISEPPSWKPSVHQVLGCLLSWGCCCQSCLNSLHSLITVCACNPSVTLHGSKLLANCTKRSGKDSYGQFIDKPLPRGCRSMLMAGLSAIQREHVPSWGHTLPPHQSHTLSWPTTLQHWHSLASLHTYLVLNLQWGKGKTRKKEK